MKYFIGLDIGTSAVKGVLLNENKNIVATITRKHNYYFENGLKLLNADEFADGCIEVIKELAQKVNDEIVAICTSGASGNIMFKSKENSPIYNWQNVFDKEIVDKYIGEYTSDDIRSIVGWPKQYGFPLGVLAYIKETNPELIEKADHICMSMEYLNFKLTGKWGITPSMGTPFYLIEQETGKYYKKFLDVFGISENKLPPIMPNCSVLGTVTDEIAKSTGLSVCTKVVLGTFDHPSAARGAGVFNESDVLLSCGTSWVVFIPFLTRKEPLEKGMLVDPFMSPNGKWSGMKSISSIAVKIENTKKQYFGNISYEEFDALVLKAGRSSLEIDLDNPRELPTNTEKSYIARGIVVAAAEKLSSMLDALGVSAKELTIVGGITNSKVWLSVIEEIIGCKVNVVNGECAGAVGAAAMAGVGAGVFCSEKELF